MSTLSSLYRTPLALLTDLYQLTMAYAHWHAGTAEREAVFHLVARDAPFAGDAIVFCGLQAVVEQVERFSFAEDDLCYLATLRDSRDGRLLPDAFLDYLRTLQLRCDIDAPPEGSVVSPQTPLLRVRGPVLQAQLLETVLLTLTGFPSLVATKAARLAHAAGETPVIDFGLRKAHGIDGGITAARAAYVGGCAGTANVLAGKLFGIPVRGTHAHGWVMVFEDELEAFDTYARALPDNCIFLVDTYQSHAGIRNAIAAGRKLRQRGHEMVGIRLDSGDLGALARDARQMLDAAGFPNAAIVASSSLDEQDIAALRASGAPIAVWGVGTTLSVGRPDAALDVVYKPSSIRGADGAWRPLIKVSDAEEKMSWPGILQLRRYVRDGAPVIDLLYDTATAEATPTVGRDRHSGAIVPMPAHDAQRELLVPVVRNGKRCSPQPSLEATRNRARTEYAQHAARPWPMAVDSGLWEARAALREQALEKHGDDAQSCDCK